ncbi:MAG: YaiO family outer membrane beta-barrel protein [Bacteroidota bacterium]
MNKESYKRKYLWLSICLCFGIINLVQAQRVSSDDLLKQAIEKINVDQDYPEAIRLGKQGLAISPDYIDIQLLLARAYVATKDYPAAVQMLQSVLSKQPDNKDALNYMINAYYEQKDFTNALVYTNKYLKIYPQDENMQLRKLDFVRAQGGVKDAYILSDSLAKLYPQNNKIKLVNNDLLLLTRQNRVGLSYAVTAFDQSGRKPWDIYSASYLRSEKYGSIIGRAYYADRKSSRGYQFEVEAYPLHGKSYSLISMSYSNSIVFPRFRFGYSFYFPVSKGWEPELGLRYQKNDEEFVSFTGALGKYFGKYWLSLRTFVTPNGKNVANSYTLSGRYYIKESVDNYLTAILGYGFSPDDRGRNFDFANRINVQNARATIGYQRTLLKTNIVGIFGGWNNFRYPNTQRNEIDVSISFQHKF